VLRSEVEKMTFDLIRQTRDAMANIPARVSGILAATSDQSEVFRLLTQEIVQAMEGPAGGPGVWLSKQYSKQGADCDHAP
jgi:hypothetical protein